MATIQTAIKQYLDNRAATDELFAAKYKNPKKSIDECCKYITGEAHARAKNGCAVIPDEEVYGWAVHYYDEDNITIRKAPRASSTRSQEPKLTPEQQETLRKQAEKEYKAQVIANLKHAELERKAKLREKKKEPQMASLFD